MIDDQMVYRMARWLHDRSSAGLWDPTDVIDCDTDAEFLPTEEERAEAMSALQHALQETIGPNVTLQVIGNRVEYAPNDGIYLDAAVDARTVSTRPMLGRVGLVAEAIRRTDAILQSLRAAADWPARPHDPDTPPTSDQMWEYIQHLEAAYVAQVVTSAR